MTVKQAASMGDPAVLLSQLSSLSFDLDRNVADLKEYHAKLERRDPDRYRNSSIVDAAWKQFGDILGSRKVRDLGFALLQDYDMTVAHRKAVEVGVHLLSHGARPKAPRTGDRALAMASFVLDRCITVQNLLSSAKVVIESGKKHSTEGVGATANATKFPAGSFTVVNSGGFPEKTIRTVVDLVKKADQALKRSGFPQVCYGPVFITKTVGRSSSVLAFYDLKTDDMYVRANLKGSGNSILLNFLHEVGHRFDFKFLKDNQGKQRLYNEVSRQEGQREFIAPIVGTQFKDHKGLNWEVLRVSGSSLYVQDAEGRTGTMSVRGYYEQTGKLRDTANPKHLGFVSAYAKTDPDENFAEMFSLYCDDTLPVMQSLSFEEVCFGKQDTSRKTALAQS